MVNGTTQSYFLLKRLGEKRTIYIWILGVLIGYLILLFQIDISGSSLTIGFKNLNPVFIIQSSAWVLPFSTIFLLVIAVIIWRIQEMLFVTSKEIMEENHKRELAKAAEEQNRQTKENERLSKEVEHLKELNFQLMNKLNSRRSIFE